MKEDAKDAFRNTDSGQRFRTHAYYREDTRNYALVFWEMSPAYKKPGYQIRKHEVGLHGSASTRIHDELPEYDAFLKMMEIEREAATKLKPMDEQEAEGNKMLAREEFRDAAPHHPHSEALVSGINNARLRLRKKNPNLKLKP